MPSLPEIIDSLAAEHGFSGVVSVDRDGEAEFARAYGLAHRGYGVPNTVDTRFATASGTKGLTALAVVGLIERGVLAPDTTARSLLGADLPLVGDDVTVEHLLAHRSGIGDYLDEEVEYDINDYVLGVPAQDLLTTEKFVPILDGHPAKFRAGERFAYCNGGYILLALLAERASGIGFHELVEKTVCAPAGMPDTEFLRSDELPGRTATGYLSIDGVDRTNVFHLPVRGNGDGGIYTTAADMTALWRSFFAGRIVSPRWVAEMVRPRSTETDEPFFRYGLGFWLHPTGDAVQLEGYDPGVSFRSVHDPATRLTWTVASNTTDGAWPIARRLRELLSR